MGVDRNEKIWAWSNTGNTIHAFVSPAGDGKLRAMCRKTILRNSDAVFNGKYDTSYPTYLCTRCMKLATAMWDRAEASMEPATEAHDLGYVAPVDEREDAEGAAIDALHAEAIEMDTEETAKVKLQALWGSTVKPREGNLAWGSDVRATVVACFPGKNNETSRARLQIQTDSKTYEITRSLAYLQETWTQA